MIFCKNEWPTFGTRWPSEGTFDPYVLFRTKDIIFRKLGYPDQIPYIFTGLLFLQDKGTTQYSPFRRARGRRTANPLPSYSKEYWGWTPLFTSPLLALSPNWSGAPRGCVQGNLSVPPFNRRRVQRDLPQVAVSVALPLRAVGMGWGGQWTNAVLALCH